MRQISAQEFKALLPGAKVAGMNGGGVTYVSAQGKMFAQMHNGTDWNYAIFP